MAFVCYASAWPRFEDTPAVYADALYFMADVPAFGFATFTLVFNANATGTVRPTVTQGVQTIKNEQVTVQFDTVTGVMASVSTASATVKV